MLAGGISMRSLLASICLALACILAGGCSSSEYNEGYRAGVEAMRKGMEMNDPSKEEMVEEDAPIPEVVEQPTRSAEWERGFKDGFRDEQRKYSKR